MIKQILNTLNDIVSRNIKKYAVVVLALLLFAITINAAMALPEINPNYKDFSYNTYNTANIAKLDSFNTNPSTSNQLINKKLTWQPWSAQAAASRWRATRRPGSCISTRDTRWQHPQPWYGWGT